MLLTDFFSRSTVFPDGWISLLELSCIYTLWVQQRSLRLVYFDFTCCCNVCTALFSSNPETSPTRHIYDTGEGHLAHMSVIVKKRATWPNGTFEQSSVSPQTKTLKLHSQIYFKCNAVFSYRHIFRQSYEPLDECFFHNPPSLILIQWLQICGPWFLSISLHQ